MSNISARLLPDPDLGVILNAYKFGIYMLYYVIGRQTEQETIDSINAHLLDNGGTLLTAAEIADMQAMKTEYDQTGQPDKSEWRDMILTASQQVQDEEWTEAFWDTLFGLGA